MFPGVSGLVMKEDVDDILTEEGRYVLEKTMYKYHYMRCSINSVQTYK